MIDSNQMKKTPSVKSVTQESVNNAQTNQEKQKADIKEKSPALQSKTIKKWFKAVIEIATVATAALAWFTLIEMRTERINAYRPEVVIAPNEFVGGIYEPEESDLSKNYVYIDFEKQDPGDWYLGTTRTPEVRIPTSNFGLDSNYFWWNDEKREIDYSNIMYVEAPYLTLNNIGNGTAKDVRITLSMDWLDNSIDVLNEHTDYIYTMKPYALNKYRILYSKDDERQMLCEFQKDVNEINITYMSSDEGPIFVALPDAWYNVFATMCTQRMQEFFAIYKTSKPEYAAGFVMELPDLALTIQYSDIQGIQYKQEEVIPWRADFQYVKSETSTEDIEWLVKFRTSFYGDYFR